MTSRLHYPGEILHERYEIQVYLAEGGMQQVYQATDLSFNRAIALKVPIGSSGEKRFARSARMSARVNHPNVAKTLDYFEEGGKFYLIEELIDGTDLDASFKAMYTALDPHLSAHLIHHIAKGVAASHHADVCHRDLKPSNIMVSRDASMREIKITDFGIAKLAEEEIAQNIHDDSSITASHTLVGALPYMAPEVIADYRQAGKPADVWALGAMLHFFITGEPPYGRGLPAVPRILQEPPPPPPSHFEKAKQFHPLTEDLWAILTRCLSKDQAVRPTAHDLVEQCSALCYSSGTRQCGVFKNYSRYGNRSYGWIMAQDSSQVFFHTDSVYPNRPLDIGQRVSFACFPGYPSPRAHPVLPIK